MSHASRLAFTLALAAVAALVCSAASASLIEIKATDVFDGTTHFGPGTYTGMPGANHGISADGKTVNLALGDQVSFTAYIDLSSLTGTTAGLQSAALSLRTADYDSVTGAATSGLGADRFGVLAMNTVDGTVYPATSNTDTPISFASQARDAGVASTFGVPQIQDTQGLLGGGWAALAGGGAWAGSIAGDNDVHPAQSGFFTGTEAAHVGSFMTSTPAMLYTYTAAASATAGAGTRRTMLNVMTGSAFVQDGSDGASQLTLLTAAGGLVTTGFVPAVSDIGAGVIVGVNVPPVPEPGTMALLLVGAVAVLFARRRLWG